MVGLGGLEPPTSRLSGVRSNQLSYRPTPSATVRRRSSLDRRWPPPMPSRMGPMGTRAWLDAGGTNRARPACRPGPSQPQAPEREKNSARTGKSGRDDLGSAAAGPKPPTTCLPRKEVIQPHLPVRLPCYDLAPITGLTLGGCLLAVGTPTLGTTNFRGLTGGVYKARERIHRCLLISDY